MAGPDPGDYLAYFDTIDNSVMRLQTKVDLNNIKYPLMIYVKDSIDHFSRSVSCQLNFRQALAQVLPHLFDPASQELLPQFAAVKAKICGFEVPNDTPMKYLYETFKNIDGFLHLTLVF